MSIFFGGEKIQASGYKPLAVYSELSNPKPDSLKLRQAFCTYKTNGDSLELMGAVTVNSSNGIGYGFSFGILKMPDTGYVLDQSSSRFSGCVESLTGRLMDTTDAYLNGDELKLSVVTTDTTTTNVVSGGAVIFHLFFNKS